MSSKLYIQDCQTSGIRLSIQNKIQGQGNIRIFFNLSEKIANLKQYPGKSPYINFFLRKLICEGETKVRECYNNDYPFAAVLIFIRVLLFQVCVPEPVGVRARL